MAGRMDLDGRERIARVELSSKVVLLNGGYGGWYGMVW